MSDGVLDWENLSEEDKLKAEKLYNELQELFDKYTKKEDEPCEDLTSGE